MIDATGGATNYSYMRLWIPLAVPKDMGRLCKENICDERSG
jgi:hypothetical protein